MRNDRKIFAIVEELSNEFTVKKTGKVCIMQH